METVIEYLNHPGSWLVALGLIGLRALRALPQVATAYEKFARVRTETGRTARRWRRQAARSRRRRAGWKRLGKTLRAAVREGPPSGDPIGPSPPQ